MYTCVLCVHIYTERKKGSLHLAPSGFEPQDCFEILILLPSVSECRNL